MKTLTFNDGTTVHGYGIEESGNLYVYIHEKTYEEASAILNNPEMTCRMVSKLPTGEVVHEGYTVPVDITAMDILFTSATMRREADGEENEDDG